MHINATSQTLNHKERIDKFNAKLYSIIFQISAEYWVLENVLFE